jgi:hypothetical protein
MTDDARRTGAAVEAHFQFLMWLVPAIEKFPRTQKFLLGDGIQTTAPKKRLASAAPFRDQQSRAPPAARYVPASACRPMSVILPAAAPRAGARDARSV